MNNKWTENKLLLWLLLTVVLAGVFIFLINYKELYDQTFFYVFQERDIERARKLLNGKMIFFGPELTGGGNLPGPLYYLCLSVALFFKSHWTSAWIMQLLFAFFGALFGFFFFSKKSPSVISALWFILFTTAPMTFRFLQIFLNVSSLLPFCVASLFFIHNSFNAIEEKNKNASFLAACFFIGLGIQFHYSLICLFLALIFMQLGASWLKLNSRSKKTQLTGYALFLVPSIPYIIWSLLRKFGINIGDPGFYIGEVKNAPASLAYLLQFAQATNPEGLWFGSFSKLIFTIPFPLFFIWISALIKKYFIKSSEQNDSLKHLKPILICLIFSTIPYLNWYLSSQAVRYTMPFYIILLILTVYLYQWMIQSFSMTKIFNWITSVFFVGYSVWFYSTFPANIFYKFLFQTTLALALILFVLFVFEKNKLFFQSTTILSLVLIVCTNQMQFLTKDFRSITSYHWALFLPQTYEWEHIWETVHKNTGWTYEEARKRIYYAGHHLEQSPQLFLDGYKFKEPVTKMKMMPDGFFISNRVRLQKTQAPFFYSLDFSKFIPKGWLLHQNLQPEVRDALLSNEIVIGKNLSTMIFISPYWVKNKKNIPQFFHNNGEGYKLSADDKMLDMITEDNGVKKLSENQFLFKWNENPECKQFCATGALVSYDKINSENYTFKVKVVGFTLSQISPWINPNWTEAWVNPYMEIGCDNTKTMFSISNSIGFRRMISQNVGTPLLQGNNSFVGPFEKDFELKCSGKIKTIKLGREFSAVETIQTVKTLFPASLTIEL